MNKLPIKVPRTERSHSAVVLPQHYADQFGWQEMAEAVAKIYNGLPPEQRAKTGIFGNNYGMQAQSNFSARVLAFPKRSALIRLTGCGDPATTQVKALLC